MFIQITTGEVGLWSGSVEPGQFMLVTHLVKIAVWYCLLAVIYQSNKLKLLTSLEK